MKIAFLSFALLTAALNFSGCFGNQHCLLGTLTETCTSMVQSLQERLEKLYNDFKEEKTRHERELEELRRELENRTSQLKETTNDNSADLQMFKVDFAEIRTDIDTLNASSHQLAKRLSEVVSQIADINDTVNELQSSTNIPLGHVYGDGTLNVSSPTGSGGSGGVGDDEDDLLEGDIFVNWNIDEDHLTFPLTLNGGMEFVNSSYKVPKIGIYYIYAQLEITSGSSFCGFGIDIASDPLSPGIDRIAESKITPAATSGGRITLYAGTARRLDRETAVFLDAVQGDGCSYNFLPETSFFGLFLLVE